MRVPLVIASFVVIGAAAVTAAVTRAALPSPHTSFHAHHHSESGINDYHLQLDVAGSARRASLLFVYSARCNATPNYSNVPISRGGTVSITRTFTTTEGGGPPRTGTFEFAGRFVNSKELSGTWRIQMAACDTGVQPFTATPGEDEHLGHLGGPAPVNAATPAELAEARRLWRLSKRSARRLFPSYRIALRRHYRPHPDECRRARFFHLENLAYRRDRHRLDPRHPESLVYWQVLHHSPVLVGFMFRVRRGHEPAFAGPIGNWHTHGAGPTSMMHVWFTNELVTAYWRGHEAPVEAIKRELIAPLESLPQPAPPGYRGGRCAPRD